MLTSNSQLKRLAWESLRGNWGNAILTLIVFLLLSYLSVLVPLGSIFIGAPLGVGIVYYFLKMAKNETVEVGLIFKPFNFYGNSLLAWFLKFLISLLALVPFIIVLVVMLFKFSFDIEDTLSNAFTSLYYFVILLITLILPIWVNIRLFLVYYIISDYNDFPADKAISLSWKAMRGKEWKLVGLYLSFIGWFLLGIITIGIAFLWGVPYLYTAFANFYLDVKNAENLEAVINAELNKESMPIVDDAV